MSVTRATMVERVVARVRADGHPLPEVVTFHRTRAGRAQRTSGAWSWFLLDGDGREVLGCFVAMRELLTYERWAYGWDLSALPAMVLLVDPA